MNNSSSVTPQVAIPARSHVTVTDTRLQGRLLLSARIGWAVLVALILLIFAASIPNYSRLLFNQLCVTASCSTTQQVAYVRELHALGLSEAFYVTYTVMCYVVFVCGYFAVGMVLFWRKSNDWMALITSLTLMAFPLAFTGGLITLPPPWLFPARFVICLGDIGITLFFCLFPDGKFVPRWGCWFLIGSSILWCVNVYLSYPLDRYYPTIDYVLFFIYLGIIVGMQIYRYRRISNAVQRQQTKWVVFGASVGICGFLTVLLVGLLFFPGTSTFSSSPLADLVSTPLIDAFILLFPLSIAFAILHSRLWDIDIIINRTLVYGILSACVVGLYVIVVGGLSALFQAHGNLFISLLATGLVALIFQPLRERLQRGVNRLMYGERDDPYAVLSRLGQRLEATLAPESALPTIVETVSQALKLPYAAITLKQQQEFNTVASYGDSSLLEAHGEELVRLPLVYHAEQVGELILAPRAPGESFTPADRQLLDDIARQGGIAAHAVRLSADLQRSRERLVNTREEERRRLRRDLHDGLGPTLAALNLQAGVIRAQITSDPTSAEMLVVEWRAELRTAIANIRRLVYELRPPALDELGLVGAIQESAARYTIHQTNGLRVSVEASELPSTLPAAIEVAAFRIAQEALANVVNHAQAHTCHILLEASHDLRLEITDDGVGLPEKHRTGIGLLSMRERAEELGGICKVEPIAEGGTRVSAQLPLPEE